MSRLDLMSDEEVIKWIKKRITIICLILITLVLIVYSRVICKLDPNLLNYFMIIAIFIYLISVLSIKFFLDKLIFNISNNKKAEMAKLIRAKYNKK